MILLTEIFSLGSNLDHLASLKLGFNLTDFDARTRKNTGNKTTEDFSLLISADGD